MTQESPQTDTDRLPRRFCLGMATYDDPEGVWWTIHGVRNQFPDDDVEFVVIDNNPESEKGAKTREMFLRMGVHGVYVPVTEWRSTSVREIVFEVAVSPIVVCVDPHICFPPRSLESAVSYLESLADAHAPVLLQGPMLSDDRKNQFSHWTHGWGGLMFGKWAMMDKSLHGSSVPFEIPMQGLGVFACRATHWLGLHRGFKGFGGEEGYLHMKYRNRGGYCLCLPTFLWLHRFCRAGTPYPNLVWERIHNYILGWREQKVPDDLMSEMIDYFTKSTNAESVRFAFAEALVSEFRQKSKNTAEREIDRLTNKPRK